MVSTSEVASEVKPRLRGWLHLGTAPLTLVAGAVLIALSPTPTTRIGSAIFVASGLVLFTVSAFYHRGRWSPRTWAFLRRIDHSSIFVLIAGSYTPVTLLFLSGSDRWVLLGVVWTGALAGMVFRFLWMGAPRGLYVPIYMGLGWAAVFYAAQFFQGAERYAGIGILAFALVVIGGALYTLGGVVYGLKRPNPSPRWFGFHEVFHSLTVMAFLAHYVGISLATYSLR